MNPPAIAVVGLACVYPDARTPVELWENVLAQRRAFRRLPPERLRVEDYWSADPAAADRTYSAQAAVIANYEFDRVGFRVVGSTFRSADLAHWLALDVASQALADAGFAAGKGLPRETTGVLLGNTLTGEFSRANALRLRWPYVRRVVEAALLRENWPAQNRRAFLEQLESEYKAPFPPAGEESLAGGLSNTIAGRICNHFDLKGGGYTVDGACSSSLLAVANACTALTAGDLDVALAGGVDLSLDPFELVGFAKTGALAREEMRVFDRRSEGFWPGEGCGFVTLMRQEDAVARGCRVYAVICGWGISSDGSGGITRPEPDGQIEALRRAYRRAGFGIDTVSYFEGHGTGTAVGDTAELEALSRARWEARSDAPPAAIGSIKANIGHTKSAAGLAGLLKAVMAVHTQVLPPTTACEQPHPLLGAPGRALRPLREAETWPLDQPLRAGVSAMGFGGINAHVVLGNPGAVRRHSLSSREHLLTRSHQDAELFLLQAETVAGLAEQVEQLLALAGGLARADLADLAAQLQKNLTVGAVRGAVIASKPAELAEHLRTLLGWLNAGNTPRFRFSEAVFLGNGGPPPRLAFLFPGQGSPAHLDGGIWRRRFESVRHLYERANLSGAEGSFSTRVMQPAVVTASLAGLKILEDLGLRAVAAVGHSLGELTAMHWAGVVNEETLLRIVHARGAAMAELGGPTGAMLAIAAPAAKVQPFLLDTPLTIVGFNSPWQTVVAGEAAAIDRLVHRTRAARWQAALLPVSHAFHTPLVAAAAPVLAAHLARETFVPPQRPVISTITGAPLDGAEDLRALLCRQVTSPVRFASALAALWDSDVDLALEVGPGEILAGLTRDSSDVPVIALDAGSASLRGLLKATGAAFALGAPVRPEVLFADRFTRQFALDGKPKFFVNPCELAPMHAEEKCDESPLPTRELQSSRTSLPPLAQSLDISQTPLELVRRLVAERAELPFASVTDHNRMLSDLHLNSITVGQVVSEAARRLGLPRVVGLTDFANASVAETARALEELKLAGLTPRHEDTNRQPPGVDIWFESFTVELVESARGAAVASHNGHLDGNHAGKSPLTEVCGCTAGGESCASGGWQVFAPPDHALAQELRVKLAADGASGVMLCLPEHPGEDHIPLLLEAGRATLALKGQPRFVLVQHGWGASSFARTLHLETLGLAVCVVNVPRAHPRAAEWVLEEVQSATGYTEAHYDAQGRRCAPRLKWLPPVTAEAGRTSDQTAPLETSSTAATSDSSLPRKGFPIGPGDVLLVSGGGKGIGAECALALGRATGAGLALLGRADPAADPELAENLARIGASGLQWCYLRADVTDAAAVLAAVQEAEQKLGPITALLHGAGTNSPQLIAALDTAAFRRTVAPKLQGARNLLSALNPDRLRLFITFGSIISRAGLPGESDYATANEWMTAFTEEFASHHPQCRCLALEWSVWSGVGMGERLGRVDWLIQHGIMPLPPDEGVRLLLQLVQCPPPTVAAVVTGRFGEPPALQLTEPELPLRRFLERKRVFYPGVELLVDAELSVASDPYLDDHALQKQRLFPAVVGLEAMAQAAMALTGATIPPIFEQVELARPVSVSDTAPTMIRLAALRRASGLVEVCLRSEETDYHVDHFRALCRFESDEPKLTKPEHGGISQELTANRTARLVSGLSSERLPLEPLQDLYGRILFHQGRFCRVAGYRSLSARECLAEITPATGVSWFGPYLPGRFVLGDPAARDAALHAIQACIPHLRILPTGIERLEIRRLETGPHFVCARERLRDGNNFVYDVDITDARGEIVERWDGLRLRAVEPISSSAPWPVALLRPYLERRLEELVPHSRLGLVLEPDGAPSTAPMGGKQRRERSDAALRKALGKAATIWRRPDGKPVTLDGEGLSIAHAQGLALAVTGRGDAACDLEPVVARSEAVWRDLLGDERFLLAVQLAGEQSETLDAAATRLWTVAECLKKAGLPPEGPLVLEPPTTDGWVLLRSGSLAIATCVVAVRDLKTALAVAVALPATAARERHGTARPALA